MTAFVPRSQQDIVAALLAYRTSDPAVAAGLLPSDLNVGSLERAHLESIALLMEEQDYRVAMALVNAISESCYRAFGFSLLPPQNAVGGVVLSAFVPPASNIPIPSGYPVLGASGLIFETTAPATLLAGQLSTAPVPIRCSTSGTAGNVAANTITKFVVPLAGIDMVTNPSATVGGSDTETEDARAVRFAAFLRTLVRGTKEALEFAALSATTQVQDARAIEPFLLNPRPDGVPYAGLVWLFVDDGTSATTLDPGVYQEIINLVEGFVDGSGNPVPGYKAAGTRVEILKVTRIPVYVRGTITLRPGGVARWADIQTNLTAAANQYFSRLRVGEKASYQNLVNFLSDCDPDLAEVDLVFWGPTSPVPAYTDPISASDITFYDPVSPYSVGSRGSLFAGTALGPGNVQVSYPEWRLA